MISHNAISTPMRTDAGSLYFARPAEIKIGMIVYDGIKDMPARVKAIEGKNFRLERPAGLQWTSRFLKLRRATDREVSQFRAITKLNTRQRAIAANGRARMRGCERVRPRGY